MTEPEWLFGVDPNPMLRYLLGTDFPRIQAVEVFPNCKGSDRKLRLFACACYRRVQHLFPDLRAQAAVEVAERVADGLLPVEELQRSESQIREPLDAMEAQWRASRGAERMALLPTHDALALGLVILWREAQKAAYYASSNAYFAVAAIANPGDSSSDRYFHTSQMAEARAQTDLLRCIFGNPFRIAAMDASWLTSTVVSLAQGIYADRAFDRLPILADALQDTGCECDEVLTHCRDPKGIHVRGCWVVDLVLGKL